MILGKIFDLIREFLSKIEPTEYINEAITSITSAFDNIIKMQHYPIESTGRKLYLDYISADLKRADKAITKARKLLPELKDKLEFVAYRISDLKSIVTKLRSIRTYDEQLSLTQSFLVYAREAIDKLVDILGEALAKAGIRVATA